MEASWWLSRGGAGRGSCGVCGGACGRVEFFLKKNDLDGATGSFHVTDKYNPFYEKYSC